MATKGDTFGAWIRATRKRKKLFAKDCAAAAGADGPLWSRWEHDGARKDNGYQTSDMEAESVRRVAVGLGEPEDVVFAAWSQRLQRRPAHNYNVVTFDASGHVIASADLQTGEPLNLDNAMAVTLFRQIMAKLERVETGLAELKQTTEPPESPCDPEDSDR